MQGPDVRKSTEHWKVGKEKSPALSKIRTHDLCDRCTTTTSSELQHKLALLPFEIMQEYIDNKSLFGWVLVYDISFQNTEHSYNVEVNKMYLRPSDVHKAA